MLLVYQISSNYYFYSFRLTRHEHYDTATDQCNVTNTGCSRGGGGGDKCLCISAYYESSSTCHDSKLYSKHSMQSIMDTFVRTSRTMLLNKWPHTSTVSCPLFPTNHLRIMHLEGKCFRLIACILSSIFAWWSVA